MKGILFKIGFDKTKIFATLVIIRKHDFSLKMKCALLRKISALSF